MIQVNDKTQYVELQVIGGGNWITENYPTNFHHFYSRKMLAKNETPDDYREVTDAQKAEIEASDAQWTRPEQWVIDRFNDWCYLVVNGKEVIAGGYNEATGFFECNGILDIGVDEAKAMLEYAPATRFFLPNHGENFWNFKQLGATTIRTLFPICFANRGNSTSSAANMFIGWSRLEAVNFVAAKFNNCNAIFNACGSLRRVYGLDVSLATLSSSFWNCRALEYIELKNLKTVVSFSESPFLNSDTFRYICENKANDTAISITVHPDVFAKITDEDNTEWHPLLALAEEKRITFISA